MRDMGMSRQQSFEGTVNSTAFIGLPVSPHDQCASESTRSARTFALTAGLHGRRIVRALDCCETASPNAAMSGLFLSNKTEKESHEPLDAMSELDSWNNDSWH